MVSIIIPVYNADSYLEKCLSSVMAQRFTDWECILVDDGSMDKSPEICDHWITIDSRFQVIHQENQGVSAARNHGIEASVGEYIVFIDSDDWVEVDYLSSLIDGITDKGVDLVVAGTRNWQNEDLCELLPLVGEITLSCNNADTFVENINFHYGPIAKLFKTNIIRKYAIRFPEDISLGEDLVFNFRYLEQVNVVNYVPIAAYNYWMRPGTLVSAFRKNRFDIHYSQWLLQKSFLERHDMCNEHAEKFLYNLLWAHVYERLFVPSHIELKAIYRIFSIPEYKKMKEYSYLFSCSAWIKVLILHRLATLLWCVRRVKELFH